MALPTTIGLHSQNTEVRSCQFLGQITFLFLTNHQLSEPSDARQRLADEGPSRFESTLGRQRAFELPSTRKQTARAAIVRFGWLPK